MNLHAFLRLGGNESSNFVLVVAMLLSGGTLVMADDSPLQDERKSKNEISVYYDLTEVDTSNLSHSLQGLTKPRKYSELTAKVAGGIKTVFVKEGDVVPQGTPLAVIDDQSAVAAVKVAQVKANQDAAIERSRLDFQIEDERLERLKSAVNFNATSDLELWEKKAVRDQRRAILDEANEVAELAQAQLMQAQVELANHKIVAPFTGQIIQIMKKAGTVPQLGEPVVIIADLSELEVEMHLPLSHFGKINVGDRLQLSAQQPVSRMIEAKVISVSPLINPTSNTFRCLFVIDNSDENLPAGFAVTLQSE